MRDIAVLREISTDRANDRDRSDPGEANVDGHSAYTLSRQWRSWKAALQYWSQSAG